MIFQTLTIWSSIIHGSKYQTHMTTVFFCGAICFCLWGKLLNSKILFFSLFHIYPPITVVEKQQQQSYKFSVRNRIKWIWTAHRRFIFELAIHILRFESVVQRNWVFATNSDFQISISLQPNVVDLTYFKLWSLSDKIM